MKIHFPHRTKCRDIYLNTSLIRLVHTSLLQSRTVVLIMSVGASLEVRFEKAEKISVCVRHLFDQSSFNL